jgi:hypothetical protein
MKITITGAHRVGKTTLAEKLHEYLPDYNLKTEPYYELEESGYLFSEIPDTDDFYKLITYSAEQISTSGDNVIFDRCPIDFFAYIQAIDKSINIQPIFNKVKSKISEIDLLVFVPIEEPDIIICPESDLPELRDKVNEILIDLICDFGIETMEVRGTLSDRRDQVISKMSLGLKNNFSL